MVNTNFRSLLTSNFHLNGKSEEEAKDKVQVTYENFGREKAKEHDGNQSGLLNCLAGIREEMKQHYRNNKSKQEELREPFREKLASCREDLTLAEKEVEKIRADDIPAAEKKVLDIQEEIIHIRKNPEDAGLLTDNTNLFQLIVGGVILAGLTVYLFLFYTSTAWSAFFKEFKLSEETLANALFDPQALSHAWESSPTAFGLILFAPFIFLGLGFLIHGFVEKKQYWGLGILASVTLAFDVVLAYHITQKIHALQEMMTFSDEPAEPFTLWSAFWESDFWLIIFAGFIVYMIWGALYWYWLSKLDNLNGARAVLKAMDRRLQLYKGRIQKAKVAAWEAEKKSISLRERIQELERKIRGVFIPEKEFEHITRQFANGWLEWMKSDKKAQNDIDQSYDKVEAFLETHQNNLEVAG